MTSITYLMWSTHAFAPKRSISSPMKFIMHSRAARVLRILLTYESEIGAENYSSLIQRKALGLDMEPLVDSSNSKKESKSRCDCAVLLSKDLDKYWVFGGNEKRARNSPACPATNQLLAKRTECDGKTRKRRLDCRP